MRILVLFLVSIVGFAASAVQAADVQKMKCAFYDHKVANTSFHSLIDMVENERSNGDFELRQIFKFDGASSESFLNCPMNIRWVNKTSNPFGGVMYLSNAGTDVFSRKPNFSVCEYTGRFVGRDTKSDNVVCLVPLK